MWVSLKKNSYHVQSQASHTQSCSFKYRSVGPTLAPLKWYYLRLGHRKMVFFKAPQAVLMYGQGWNSPTIVVVPTRLYAFVLHRGVEKREHMCAQAPASLAIVCCYAWDQIDRKGLTRATTEHCWCYWPSFHYRGGLASSLCSLAINFDCSYPLLISCWGS